MKIRALVAAVALTAGVLGMGGTADAAVQEVCVGSWVDIPPPGGALAGPNAGHTMNQQLQGDAGNRIWVGIKGLDSGVWLSSLDVDFSNTSPGSWQGSWTNLGGQALSFPKFFITGNGQLAVAVVGTDGNTYIRIRVPSTWTSWQAHSVGAGFYNSLGSSNTIHLNNPIGQDWRFDFRRSGNTPQRFCQKVTL